MGKVLNQLKEKLKKEKLHFSLLDPEKLTPDKAADLAKKVTDFGSDAIMLGGSTAGSVDLIAKAIKENTKLPLILFPNSAGGLTKYADAVFFMSLLNSTKREYLIGEQVKGAPLVREYNLEPIPMGYIVINTGEPTAVEKIAQIQRLTKEEIVNYALAAQYFGMELVYLEAGSGAQSSVSDDIIQAVREVLDIPLIVGGGINGPLVAQKKLDAGADIIVTGTVIERAYGKAAEIIDAVKNYKK
ncbi:TPA: geranylgeranylglyceryl/heptaprenylglyceryl phosphate synthase [archaeon]|nr:geranylgeranylglyceryl/heptaprenylglyceryl phosphate synthase [Candidatus Naiadarchaeales archaeon SRR2090159.bin1288]